MELWESLTLCLAGLGGSVLANRLSANPNNRVLLIEAGPRSADLFFYSHSGAEFPQ
jgi:choline dehydrogenase-like flavoprotein